IPHGVRLQHVGARGHRRAPLRGDPRLVQRVHRTGSLARVPGGLLMAAPSFDAIVVGSGITGGWAAKGCCEAGLRTLVLGAGRQVYRWSDLDFEANARDGFGVDWPIRYADIAPWYDYVEEFIGISGEALGLPQLPDGKFLAPMALNCAEQVVRDGVAKRFASE